MASGYTLSEGAVRKLAGLVRGGMPESRRRSTGPATVDVEQYPPPFTVRWSAQQNNGVGGWVIYLSGYAALVWYGDRYVSISGLTAATGLPTNWYQVPDVQTSNAVYLAITTNDSSGAVTAEIYRGAKAASTGETVQNLKIAALFEGPLAGQKRVRQYIVGAVTLGGGGGGGGVSVGTPKTAATSIEYTDGYDASHPYAIKLTRGYLAATANTLTIDPQDGGTGTAANLTQYIDTVPISSVVEPDSLISSN